MIKSKTTYSIFKRGPKRVKWVDYPVVNGVHINTFRYNMAIADEVPIESCCCLVCGATHEICEHNRLVRGGKECEGEVTHNEIIERCKNRNPWWCEEGGGRS